MDKPKRRVFNATETAQYLGRSMNNTLDLLKSGVIPAIRVDKRWMIYEDILINWLIEESNRQAKARQEQTLPTKGGI